MTESIIQVVRSKQAPNCKLNASEFIQYPKPPMPSWSKPSPTKSPRTLTSHWSTRRPMASMQREFEHPCSTPRSLILLPRRDLAVHNTARLTPFQRITANRDLDESRMTQLRKLRIRLPTSSSLAVNGRRSEIASSLSNRGAATTRTYGAVPDDSIGFHCHRLERNSFQTSSRPGPTAPLRNEYGELTSSRKESDNGTACGWMGKRYSLGGPLVKEKRNSILGHTLDFEVPNTPPQQHTPRSTRSKVSPSPKLCPFATL